MLIAAADKCYKKRISSAEHGDFNTITVQQGLSGGSQEERKHHLLRLQKTIQVGTRVWVGSTFQRLLISHLALNTASMAWVAVIMFLYTGYHQWLSM